jgi:hypothetical protein
VVEGPGLRSAAAARNAGVKGAEPVDLFIFVDADVVVAPDALRWLVEAVSGGADAAVGRYGIDVEGLSFAAAYKHLYLAHVYSRRSGPLRDEFWTALGAVRAEVFHRVGGFAEDFKGAAGEDTEFGQRLGAAAAVVMAEPRAVGRHLKEHSLRSLVENDLRKGVTSVRVILGGGRRLHDFRHAGRRDMLAVGLSGAALGAALLGPVFPPALLGSGGALVGWAICRAELARAFAGQPLSFRAAAAPTMFLLDLVRGFALVGGLASMGVERLRGAGR